jgi:hypothetical protein
MFCALRGKSVEATFWALELLDSELIEELMTALQQIWLYGFGVKALGWYRQYTRIFQEEEIIQECVLALVSELCRLASNGKRDRSILTLLCAEIIPDRVNIQNIHSRFTPVEGFAYRAILQRKTLTAWGAIRGMESPDAFLKRAAMRKHGVKAGIFLKLLSGDIWEQRATAVAALCLSKEEFIASWNQVLHPILNEVARELPVWSELLGRRERRIYRIPPECLGYTQRGKLSVYESNEKDIMGRMEKPSGLWYSPFWDSVAELYGGWEAVKEDPVIREAFYAKYFPDDIPDEWSKDSRAKSHGTGASADLSKTFQAWYGRLPAATLWGPLKYKEWNLGPIDIGSWNLTPVKRIIRPETL